MLGLNPRTEHKEYDSVWGQALNARKAVGVCGPEGAHLPGKNTEQVK